MNNKKGKLGHLGQTGSDPDLGGKSLNDSGVSNLGHDFRRERRAENMFLKMYSFLGQNKKAHPASVKNATLNERTTATMIMNDNPHIRRATTFFPPPLPEPPPAPPGLPIPPG